MGVELRTPPPIGTGTKPVPPPKADKGRVLCSGGARPAKEINKIKL